MLNFNIKAISYIYFILVKILKIFLIDDLHFILKQFLALSLYEIILMILGEKDALIIHNFV